MTRRATTCLGAIVLLLFSAAFVHLAVAQETVRTRAEVDAIIDEAGKTKPDWWDAEPFNPPPNLDLTWHKVTGWKPNENMGTHMFIVCPRPDKWRYAVKLLDASLAQMGAADAQRKDCMVLMGDFYCRLEDWPRAAYWWRQAKVAGSGDQPYGLFLCTWKLGGKGLAAQMLSGVRTDTTRRASAVRLWGEMGETDKALALARASAAARPDAVWLAAGDVCRRAGRYADAAAHYKKAAAAQGRTDPRNIERARANLAAVELLAGLDLKAVPDGSWAGAARGYRGDVAVQVTVKAGAIAAVRVTAQKEDRAFNAIRDLPGRITTHQGIAGVDAITGATISSEAVMNATVKALSGAGK